MVSVWYVVDWKSCVRIVAFAIFACFAVFAIVLSSDLVYLSIYKLALTLYLLAIFMVGGLEVAMIFFDSNVWADIITCVILILLMAVVIEKKLKSTIRGFGDYVEKEVDKFSVVVMIILLGIGFILILKEANYAETGRGQQALTGRDVERLYSIALCDDDERELERIENFLASYQGRKQEVEYKTERFSSAEALLWQVRENGYLPDILLLDIFMSGKNGMGSC